MLGGATKTLQRVVELAEELYERVNDLRERVEAVSDTVEETAERVDRVEAELAEQRALLEAVGEVQGVDIEAVVATAEEPGAEPPAE